MVYLLNNQTITDISLTGGIKPKEVSADKGYSNTTQILEIEKDGQTQCYVPLIETKREQQEKGGISFQYNKETDTYLCFSESIQ